jgi:hypothetical protein
MDWYQRNLNHHYRLIEAYKEKKNGGSKNNEQR